MSGKVVNVVAIGCGVIGSAFLDQLLAMKSPITYNLILIAESKTSLISKDYKPLSLQNGWRSALQNSQQNSLSLEDMLEFLKNLLNQSSWLTTLRVPISLDFIQTSFVTESLSPLQTRRHSPLI